MRTHQSSIDSALLPVIAPHPDRKYRCICQWCQRPFLGWSAHQPFCSKQCRGRTLKGHAKVCRFCGTSFHARGTKRQYCSLACWYAKAEKTPADFWALVDTSAHPQGCWIWQGFVRSHVRNYGQFKGQLVHRYAYTLHYGVDPGAQLVCHTCDNPPCVNPAHLFLGTRLDNNQDAVRKGRNARGEKCRHAKLTETQVQTIREAWHAGGVTQRALAHVYAVSPATICEVLSGKRWKHVPSQEKAQT